MAGSLAIGRPNKGSGSAAGANQPKKHKKYNKQTQHRGTAIAWRSEGLGFESPAHSLQLTFSKLSQCKTLKKYHKFDHFRDTVDVWFVHVGHTVQRLFCEKNYLGRSKIVTFEQVPTIRTWEKKKDDISWHPLLKQHRSFWIQGLCHRYIWWQMNRGEQG